MEAINVPQLEIGIAGRAKELLMVAAEFLITDDSSLGEAADLIRQIKAAWTDADEERDRYVRPLFTATAEYNRQFKVVQAPLKDAENALKALMKTYQRVQQEKQRELEAKARKEQAELEAAAAERNEPAPPPAPPPPKVGPVRGEYGSKAILKEKWTYEITDKTLVPLKYLMVDDLAVKESIKTGARDIRGIRIFDEGVVAVS